MQKSKHHCSSKSYYLVFYSSLAVPYLLLFKKSIIPHFLKRGKLIVLQFEMILSVPINTRVIERLLDESKEQQLRELE